MHYKCHLFMSEMPTEEKVHDIMEPFRSNEGVRYSQKVNFIWSAYEVCGRYAPWNGGVLKIANLKRFDPSDCFILLDETGNSTTRDSYFTLPGLSNRRFVEEAYKMAGKYEDGYVVIIDILE